MWVMSKYPLPIADSDMLGDITSVMMPSSRGAPAKKSSNAVKCIASPGMNTWWIWAYSQNKLLTLSYRQTRPSR